MKSLPIKMMSIVGRRKKRRGKRERKIGKRKRNTRKADGNLFLLMRKFRILSGL